MLAAGSRILSAVDEERIRDLASECGELASSEGDAIQLSRRIGDRQLNIPLNAEYGGTLMYVAEDPTPLTVGSMSVCVIGPYDEDLRVLRERWNTWLADKETFLRGLQRNARSDEERIGNDENELLRSRFQIEADELMQSSDIQDFLAFSSSNQLGRRQNVTAPNLASLMPFVEDDRRTVLLTGDGHWEDILLGLEHAKKLDAAVRIHVDVLKIPHHGSEHNTNPDFCKRVTANTYVFCGNGAHKNPDLRVVDAYIDSRIGPASRRSLNDQVGNRFKLLFNANESDSDLSTAERTHMRELTRLVNSRRTGSGGKLKFEFMTRSTDRFTV